MLSLSSLTLLSALRHLGGPRWLCAGLLGMATAAPAWARQDLTAMGLEQLMDIPVMAASKYAQPQHEVAASVSVITRDDIRTFGWRTLGEALASLPGFHTTYDRQYTYVGARGLGMPDDFNTRLLITLNGNRLNEPTYDSVMAGHEFPLDQDLIERIEVIPGPGGAVYGQNALFGVINVVTRDGAGLNGTEVAAAWQSPQGQRQVRLSHGRVLDNGVDLLLSASGLRARGEDRFYDYGAGGAGVAAGLDGERADQLFLRLSRGPWSFDLAYGDRRKDDPTAAYQSDPLVPGQHIRDGYLSTQLQYEDHFAGQTQHLLARLSMGSTGTTVSRSGTARGTAAPPPARRAGSSCAGSTPPGRRTNSCWGWSCRATRARTRSRSWPTRRTTCICWPMAGAPACTRRTNGACRTRWSPRWACAPTATTSAVPT